jgi:hypothetical protein
MSKGNETVFQIGDVIRNRSTRQEGRIVRVYSDLHISQRKAPGLTYVVLDGDREAIWEGIEVEKSKPKPVSA